MRFRFSQAWLFKRCGRLVCKSELTAVYQAQAVLSIYLSLQISSLHSMYGKPQSTFFDRSKSITFKLRHFFLNKFVRMPGILWKNVFVENESSPHVRTPACVKPVKNPRSQCSRMLLRPPIEFNGFFRVLSPSILQSKPWAQAQIIVTAVTHGKRINVARKRQRLFCTPVYRRKFLPFTGALNATTRSIN